MAVEILSVGAYTPPNRVSNDQLAEIYNIDTSDEWIRSHTGIGSRYIASEEETCTDIAHQASLRALEKAGVTVDELDCIIFTTSTPDYKIFPASASILQDKLGAKNAGAFDLAQGCTGFIYGLEVGRSMILGGMKKVLVVGAEKLSTYLNWNDRSTCVLFGDGAGAVVLSHTNEDKSDIFDKYLRSEGSGAEALKVHKGGSKNPLVIGEPVDEDSFIFMDGRQVYNFAVRSVTEVIRILMEKHNISIDDLKYIVPHQANQRIIQAAAKRLGMSMDKFYLNIEEFANTSAATIPIALNEMDEKGLLEKGDLILTVGFGAGLAYGGNLLRW
ncbi:beta-ketoacyl-ACP synthase III [Spirochaeta isovalerica]|uniref:Beta-ketoacyl-[acyl-carrier-protein] synthase III n=1 Tax=Spirochaeta isovalerica TaxID=150 RepID=A0A841R932_9SPIO|nr:beta-ketoacyl-ACP synthase III [Spirochaeta isovalerica]MBB6479540.1 3-oxoacyl-[acyl-carrier-protein] synthase-3 [Spirochaeta isovalerica]